jgi:hypothetical protein
MALEAEKGLLDRKEVVVHGPVGSMADAAVFGGFSMAEDKGAFFLTVAVRTGQPPELFVVYRSVCVVAVGAEYLLFRYRVMARQGELGPDLLMALIAHR